MLGLKDHNLDREVTEGVMNSPTTLEMNQEMDRMEFQIVNPSLN
jgi:hypothetical protein